MMPQQKTSTLAAIFSEVLANLAFMFNDEEDYDPCSGAAWLETTIEYRGPISERLRLYCTREFSVLLAANLLGVDPADDDAESQAEDAVKEFMNIVCGQLVTALHGTEPVFNLSIPQVTELPGTPDLNSSESNEAVNVSIEGHRVRLERQPI